MDVTTVIDGIVKIVKAPFEGVAIVEKQVSTRGIIAILLTLVVGYMSVVQIPISANMGGFYSLVISVYFGAKLGVEAIERLKSKT